MVAVTYGNTRVSKVSAKAAARATPRKSSFARFIDALVKARMQQAHREIMRHAHLLPYTLDQRGNRLVNIGGKDLPFGG
jgi:hypothetical protein